MEIKLANSDNFKLYWEHLRRHYTESGRDGDLIFSPNEKPWDLPFEEFTKEKKEKWSKNTNQVGWERVWIITDADGVYGDLKLVHLPALESCLHRATLMMGIERSHRKRGFGSKLMSTAIAWAKQQPTLAWLQLFVFDHNLPAKKLYGKFGFEQQGVVPDMFRVFGNQISDVTMALKLKRFVGPRVLFDIKPINI